MHSPPGPPHDGDATVPDPLAPTDVGRTQPVLASPTSPDDDPLLGVLLAGRYRILARLGAGGMGTVYRAVQLDLEREVAVKVLRAGAAASGQATERFRREALAVARLRHRNIITVYDLGASPDAGTFIVMEYLEGRSLRDEIARGPLDLARAVDVMRHVCAAVDAAHAAGVVHRDLKPDNVFLVDTPDGTIVKVLDFGIAKLAEERGGSSITETGIPLGTPIYMAPEQCEGGAIDARADVYALGCLLHEALTGRPPFLAPTAFALMYKHLNEPAPRPTLRAPGLPAAVDAVVLRALEKNPDARFPSAGALAAALELAASSAADTGVFGALEAASAWDGQTLVGDAVPPPHNLPTETTSFVGREHEAAEVARLLASSRLVTLTGPGGIGKTRLALRVAASILPDARDGVWLVELAPVADPALVLATIAAALRVRPEPGLTLEEGLAEAVRGRSMLVLLDNCEHVVDAAAAAASLLLRLGLRVLATSREALAIPGEAVWAVPPMVSSTNVAPGSSPSEAVELFAERARLVDRRFVLTPENAATVAAICRKLDGLPLAIELAAARVRVLSVEQILARLEDRFRLLADGGRGRLARQQTLRAAIDWSYELLTADERALLVRLSVFAGGCSLEAAEAVCTGGPIDGLALLDLLARLVDKSLVTSTETRSGQRYGMLETVREYARAKLAASDEEAAVLRAHCDWCVDLARRMRREFRGPRQQAAYDAIDLEHDNIRAALRWCLRDAREAEPALRISGALAMYWTTRGHVAEGHAWTEEALALDGGPAAARGHALYGLALLAYTTGDLGRARSAIEECLTLRRGTDDWSGIVRAMNYVAVVATAMGEYERAREAQEEALAIGAARGLADETNYGLYSLGMIALATGELGEAERLFGESLDVWRASGHRLAVAAELVRMAEAAWLAGDTGRLDARLDEAEALARELDAATVCAGALLARARARADEGALETASELLVEAAPVLRAAGDRAALAGLIEASAVIATRAGRAVDALRLAGAAEALRKSWGVPRQPAFDAALESRLAPAWGALAGEEARRAVDAGGAMGLEEALELALAVR